MNEVRKYAIKITKENCYRKLKLIVIDDEIIANNDYGEFLHKNIDCRYFDLVNTPLLEGYDLWVDDEGKLKEENRYPTMHTGICYIYGNIVITKSDIDGNIIPLSLNECKELIKLFKNRFNTNLNDNDWVNQFYLNKRGKEIFKENKFLIECYDHNTHEIEQTIKEIFK